MEFSNSDQYEGFSSVQEEGTVHSVEDSSTIEEQSFLQLQEVFEMPVEEVQRQFDAVMYDILHTPEYNQMLKVMLDTLQSTELCLTKVNDAGEKVTTPVEVSLLPIILSEKAEQTLEHLVYNVTLAKRAIVESIASNHELQEFLLSDLPEISQEIIMANLRPLADHIRLRYDTFSHPTNGTSVQIELNGGEPQGDVITATPFKMMQKVMEFYLTQLDVPAEKMEDIISKERLPIWQVADRISSIYAEYQKQIPELPARGNVGFFAFRDPDTRRPLNNLSNNEADLSVDYLVQKENIAGSCAFDPFDIVDFREITTEEGTFHLPVVNKNGMEMEIHFIRRLHGEPMENAGPGEAWEVLRERKPEVYYKFIGKEHPTYNPEGRTCFPWMWMNSLNPMMTDKKLDAIISDPQLAERFQLKKALMQSLQSRSAYDVSVEELDAKVDEVMEAAASYVPKTVYLERGRGGKGLTNETVTTIIENRSQYVLKESTLMGYSGKGVHVGKNIILDEVPQHIVQQVMSDALHNPKVREVIFDVIRMEEDQVSAFVLFRGTEQLLKDADNHDRITPLYDQIWKSLVEEALEKGGAIVQEMSTPQRFPALRTDSSDKVNFVVNACELGVDVNPQTFGDQLACPIVRMSQEAKTNITSGYGCLGSTMPESIARSFLALVEEYKKKPKQ